MSLFANRTDQALLRAFVKQQCEQSFGALVARYAPLVYTTASRHLDDTDQVQDVGQQTFCTLARKSALLARQNHLPAWLHRTTLHHAFNANRRERRQKIKLQQLQADPAMQYDHKAACLWKSLLPEVDAYLQQLPETDRSLLMKRYFVGCTTRETAEQLGLSRNAADKRIQRALVRLRKKLKGQDQLPSTSLVATALLIGSQQQSKAALAIAPVWTGLAVKIKPVTLSFPALILTSLVMKKTITITVTLAILFTLGIVVSFSRKPSSAPAETTSLLSSTETRSSKLSTQHHSTTRVSGTPSRPDSATFTGQVMDSRTHSPIPNAEITISLDEHIILEPRNDVEQQFTTTTDVNGRYECIVKVPPEGLQYSLITKAEGYAPSGGSELSAMMVIQKFSQYQKNGEEAPKDFIPAATKITAGQTMHKDFTLSPIVIVSGVVVDFMGQPITDAQVTPILSQKVTTNPALINHECTEGAVLTDSQGAFVIKSFHDDLDLQKTKVRVSHERFVTQTEEKVLILPEEARTNLRIALQAKPTMHVSVIDTAEKPVAGTHVALFEKKDDEWIACSQKVTDQKGSVILAASDFGPYLLQAWNSQTMERVAEHITIQSDGHATIQLTGMGSHQDAVTLLGAHLHPIPASQCHGFPNAKEGGLYWTSTTEQPDWMLNKFEPGLIIGFAPYSKQQPLRSAQDFANEALAAIAKARQSNQPLIPIHVARHGEKLPSIEFVKFEDHHIHQLHQLAAPEKLPGAEEK